MPGNHGNEKPEECQGCAMTSGRIVALSRFMPKMAEKIKPILSLLRKTSRFKWDEQCEKAFVQLKYF